MKYQPTGISVTSSVNWCSVNTMPTTNKKADRKKWIKDKQFYLAQTNLGDRVMTPVTVKNTTKEKQKIIFLMDAVTGSLYDYHKGSCMTSPHVWIEKIKPCKHPEEILLNLKTQSEV